MKKLDWKLLAASLAVLILTSLLPLCFVSQGELELGFPAVFYRVFNNAASLYAAHFNPFAFVFDVLLIYLVMFVAKRLLKQFMKR